MQKQRVWIPLLSAAVLAAALAGCASSPGDKTGDQISRAPFGKTAEGTPVDVFTLQNRNGVVVRIINYGGIVLSMKAPDRNGQMGDVMLGYDTLGGYLTNNPFFGCLVGRYGNRIARGKFSLNGTQYTLATNNYPNALHGGKKGFDKVVWTPRVLVTPNGPALELRYVSKDGEEGYPGTLSVTAIYSLTEDNGLRLDYTATTDKDTVVNLTQHAYFNLAGRGDILGHVVTMPAENYTPVDATLIPTGEIPSVAGTPFDFRKPTSIGARIGQDHPQIKFGGGYDHNWVFASVKKPGQLSKLATVYEPTTGRVLEVLSTEPGLQFYSGNFLDGTIKGKGGWVYKHRNGFCMEPQHYPDSPNQANFPSTVLKPGQTYRNTIIYKLSVQK